MAERSNTDVLFDAWKKQVETGTKAWTQAIGQAQTADPSQFWRPFMDGGIAAWAALMAQGPVSPDLMAQWKSFLDQWIAAWGKALEQAMGTEAFAAALGRHLEQWLALQAPVRMAAAEASEAALGAMGMPSRAEVTGIARRISDLDDRLEGLEDKLGTVIARLDTLAAVLGGSRTAGAQSGRAATKRQPKGRKQKA
ncbi:MAG: poly(R)-hydroxyalkanoic acid synthase subunit PhaE [Armatimonadota bacterium]